MIINLTDFFTGFSQVGKYSEGYLELHVHNDRRVRLEWFFSIFPSRTLLQERLHCNGLVFHGTTRFNFQLFEYFVRTFNKRLSVFLAEFP